MLVYWYIGIGGAVGSILRYLISLWTNSLNPTDFPFSTLMVNLLGASILGWFTAFLQNNEKLNKKLVLGFTTGLIGSFTTFSTLSVEVVLLLNNRHYILTFVYLILSIIGGLIFALLGFRLGYSQERGSVK